MPTSTFHCATAVLRPGICARRSDARFLALSASMRRACSLRACAPQCGPSASSTGSSMQIRNLGGSGLRVSAVGLGCNNFGQRTDLETSRKVIHKAIDLGVTLFDTADIYAGMGG